jgi:LacI family transcriptional regulator
MVSSNLGSTVATRHAGKVTIIEVALRAGVSTATAGRVLGGYGYTSDEIRDKVRRAAAALGYRPNRLARGLITGKTQTIGVVAGDIESAFYASALRGIGDVARGRGFGVIVTNSDENSRLEREAIQLLREKQVDGIIVSPADLDRSGHLREAMKSGCPVVQFDRVAHRLGMDSVTVDNQGAAERCVDLLLRAGHRRIGIIAELEKSGVGDVEQFVHHVAADSPQPRALYPSWQRLRGYLEAHRKAGVPVDLRLIRRVGAYSVRAGRDQTLDLLSGPAAPSALFTGDGLMSAAAMEAIATLGLVIPDDLSLVCFDDLDWMKFMRPGITALAQPVLDIGKAAAELVLDRIENPTAPACHRVLPATLAERGSVAGPSRARP